MRETIVAEFAARVESSARETACLTKVDGQFVETSWTDLQADVLRMATALSGWGVQRGDRVIQVSENRYEWIVTDLAIQIVQGIHVPVHAPLTGEQIAYQIEHSGAKILLLSNQAQADKLTRLAIHPTVERVFSYEPVAAHLAGAAVQELASEILDQDPNAGQEMLAAALTAVRPEDAATILYTSGTTGNPKGVVLSQRNIVSNTRATLEAFGDRVEDLRLCFLPLSHIYARTCDLYTWISRGSRLALAESRETVVADCATVQPTLLNGVPYFYEKLCRYLAESDAAESPGSLKQLLGGNVRCCCAGGAALPNHVYDFFQAQELPLYQGYGLTEASPVISLSTENNDRRGSVGKILDGVEVRIADDGEILARGPNIMLGYYREEEATQDCVRDGWLFTGDLGHIDDDGFLFITGRKKEIIVTSGGKNITPVMLESLLTQDPLIEQALVIGDGRNYLTALIVPSLDAIAPLAESMDIEMAAEALEHPKLLGVFEGRIRDRLSVVSKFEQVGKFKLLSQPFSVESGELTPKMSLKRDVICQNYADDIEAMYGSW